MAPFTLLLAALLVGASRADEGLDGQVLKASAQLDAGEAARALKTADKVLAALASGSTVSDARRDALDQVRIGALTALAGDRDQDAARRLDEATAAHTACVDRTGDASRCGDPAPLARALRARAALVQRSVLKNQGGAPAEARARCDQAAAIAPEPAGDARCLAVLALVRDDPELAAAAAERALAPPVAPSDHPAVDEAVAAAAQVIGMHHGDFDTALALVERAVALGELPTCAGLRDSLRQAVDKLAPKRSAVHENPQDPAAWRAWLLAIDAAGLDRLAVAQAGQAMQLQSAAVLEIAGVVAFNAAARGKARGEPAPVLRGWLAEAIRALDACAAAPDAPPRCAERAAGARAFDAALPP